MQLETLFQAYVISTAEVGKSYIRLQLEKHILIVFFATSKMNN